MKNIYFYQATDNPDYKRFLDINEIALITQTKSSYSDENGENATITYNLAITLKSGYELSLYFDDEVKAQEVIDKFTNE